VDGPLGAGEPLGLGLAAAADFGALAGDRYPWIPTKTTDAIAAPAMNAIADASVTRALPLRMSLLTTTLSRVSSYGACSGA
jgi:hypothetical protein